MGEKNVGLYIHIPFCKHKCEYCDFKSYAGKENLIDTYIKWLKHEIQEVGEGNRWDYQNNIDDLAIVKTIYIGGGTPSFIDEEHIKQIIETIRKFYTTHKDVEITIEVNPGTVNNSKLETYKETGINRISIGLQSTHNKLLKEMGRIHTFEQFLETYNLARKIGFENINVDLMLGLPSQSKQELEESLKEIIKIQPEHISIYSLIVEEGTPFYNKLLRNELKLPDESLEREMYWKTKRMLENEGYVHYEISNFAKLGNESKHNLDCWNQKEYVGFGVAAHSYIDDVRYGNIGNVEEYIKNCENGEFGKNKVIDEVENDIFSKEKEFMLIGLRKIEGVLIQDFKNKFGENPIFVFKDELKKLVDENLLIVDFDRIKLTNKGLDLANIVWKNFV